MSVWTHAMCLLCWRKQHGTQRVPYQLKNPEEEMCCWCFRRTLDGIYVRMDPKLTLCDERKHA